MTDPIYKSKRQRIWRLDDTRGVSLVQMKNGTYSLATVRFPEPKKGPAGGMVVDYETPPEDGLSETDALAKVEKMVGEKG